MMRLYYRLKDVWYLLIALAILATAAAMLIILVAMLFVRADADAAPVTVSDAPTLPDVLIIKQTYDGPVEVAGDLFYFKYTQPHMLIIWGDRTEDGLFHNGFDGKPAPGIPFTPPNTRPK